MKKSILSLLLAVVFVFVATEGNGPVLKARLTHLQNQNVTRTHL